MADNPLQSQQESVLLPVYDSPNARSTNAGGGLYFDQSYINCYPEVYTDPVQRAAPVIQATKRPGSLAAMTGAIVTATGIASDNHTCLANASFTQLYDVYVAAFFEATGNTIKIVQYRPIAGTALVIGTIAGCNINDMVFITEITNGTGLAPGLALSYQKADKSSGTGYYSISVAGVFTASFIAIASGSFPSNLGTPRIITGPFQFMNGHSYIMTLDGYIYESQLTSAFPDITSWNTLATVTASQYPDRGVGIYRYKHLLLAFGQNSVEFWSPDNNAPPQSSLVRTDQAFIKFGAASPKLITNIDDVIYWVSYGESDTIGVWKLEGYAPQRISGQREHNFMMNSIQIGGYPTYFTLESVLMAGKKHLIFNGVSSYSLLYASPSSFSGSDTYTVSTSVDGRAQTLCYNITDQMWWSLNMSGAVNCYIVSTTAFPSNLTAGQYKQYFFRRTAVGTGNDSVTSSRPMSWVVSGAEGTYYDDNPLGTPTTSAIPVVITWNTLWNRTTKRKFLRKLVAMMDPLTISAGDAASVLTFYFLVNKSTNNLTASDTSVIALSRPTNTSGTISSRYYINNLGAYRSLSLGIVYRSKDAFRIQGLELEVAGGTH